MLSELFKSWAERGACGHGLWRKAYLVIPHLLLGRQETPGLPVRPSQFCHSKLGLRVSTVPPRPGRWASSRCGQAGLADGSQTAPWCTLHFRGGRRGEKRREKQLREAEAPRSVSTAALLGQLCFVRLPLCKIPPYPPPAFRE